MDNHRAALWCWLQELNLNSQHSLFHIDQHTDSLQSRLDEWMDHLPSWSAGIEEYLDKSYKNEFGEREVIRWDNYLSIYFREFGSNLETCYFATHGDGDDPNHHHVMKAELWDMPNNMEYWLNQSSSPWIVNIDLDYFFWDNEGDTEVMVSDAFLSRTFRPLKDAIGSGKAVVTTICLTPDPPFTGGWEATELLAHKLLKILGMEFELPKPPSKQ